MREAKLGIRMTVQLIYNLDFCTIHNLVRSAHLLHVSTLATGLGSHSTRLAPYPSMALFFAKGVPLGTTTLHLEDGEREAAQARAWAWFPLLWVTTPGKGWRYNEKWVLLMYFNW